MPITTRISSVYTPPVVNQSLVRAGSTTKAPVLRYDPDVPATTKVPVEVQKALPPKGPTTDIHPAYIAGDPILQLERSRPFTPKPNPAIERNPWKNSDYQKVMERHIAIEPSQIKRDVLRADVQRTFARAIRDASPSVKLGTEGSGFALYMGIRQRPALPAGFAEAVAVTPQPALVGGPTTATRNIPAGVAEALRNTPSPTTLSSVVDDADIISTVDTVRVPTVPVPNDADTTGQAIGRLIFLAAALLIAVKVIR